MVASYDDALGFFPRVARIRDATGADPLGATTGADGPADGAPASIGDPTVARPNVSNRFPV